jgi:hypothetical protein
VSDALALGSVLVLFLARFHRFLLFGDVLTFRDAGFFFGPWREVFARQAAAGIPPLWNDAFSCGRAMAADPNAGVFWPVTWAVGWIGPTGLTLANTAVLLVGFYAALRLLKLSPLASAAGTVILLFSGVAQALPVFFTAPAALAPVPLALACLATLDPEDRRGAVRRTVGAAFALGLSFLGGEPAITAVGAAGCCAVVLGRLVAERRDRARAARRALLFVASGVLAIGLAAMQLVPAAGELARSPRGAGIRPEHGALFWSVKPARVLTLLEPRLTGDPFAESVEDYWGAGTFDAGNPYFYDLSLGLLPLVLAAASAFDARGRGALLLAAFAAVLSFGRYLPGYAALLAPVLSIFRYPEKWWTLATLALAAAAAVGVEAVASPATRARALVRVKRAALLVGAPLALGAAFAYVAPPVLKAIVFSLGLGAGPTQASSLASLLAPLLLVDAAACAMAAWLARLAMRSPRAPAVAACVLAGVFLLDAGRRVAGMCPSTPRDVPRRETPASRMVLAALGGGRFYDDGAERPDLAVARAKAAAGFDPLWPEAGALLGVRYAGENDIDRMTPVRSFAWARDTAALPWGEEKARRLRAAGVTVLRTASPAPDPPGVSELGRFGPDRILRLERARDELSLARRAAFVARAEPARVFAAPPDAASEAVVEAEDAPGPRTFSDGTLEVSRRDPHLTRARLHVGGAALLLVARTFDPSWRARVDGAPAPVLRADGFLMAVPLPPGAHDVELRYVNPLLLYGALASALAAAAAVLWIARAR